MIKVLSLGGGLDSFAMLVDAIERDELPDVVVFVDVGAPGDPGEWPETYRHIREVVMPLCAMYGIRFVWIDHTMYPVRDARSLFAWLHARKQIPMAGPARVCTPIAKVERFEKWMDATYPGQTVEVWIGFEAGEESRASKDPNSGKKRKPTPDRAVRVNRFPLIERGLCRCRCAQLVRDAGHEVPGGSACVFCPYSSRGEWQRFAASQPEEFARVVELEERKPRTAKNDRKLTIMAYSSKLQSGKMLPEYVGNPKPYRRKIVECGVCGAPDKLHKNVGCSFEAVN